ncbi:MAG: diadenylate cyclase CdaA [Planctomycetota bacterium]
MSELIYQIENWVATRGGLLFTAAFEVFIIFLLIYVFLRVLQGTRGVGILRGLTVFIAGIMVLTVLVSHWLPLETVNWLLTRLAPVLGVPVFILFQPEIRRALIRLGQNPVFSMFFRPHQSVTDELVAATFSLSRDKIGGLIAIERQVGLRSYVERGVRLDAEITAELIKTIFWPGTPLHDGAIVISNQRISAAGCLFPLTDNPRFSSDLGTRHRAGIGISEESDAIVIIVSEQTGRVSLAVNGAIQQDLDESALRRALEDIATEPIVGE